MTLVWLSKLTYVSAIEKDSGKTPGQQQMERLHRLPHCTAYSETSPTI
jgi:hypothetical protein